MKALHPVQQGMVDHLASNPFTLLQYPTGCGGLTAMAQACVKVGGIWQAVLPKSLHPMLRRELRDAGQAFPHSRQTELGNSPDVWLYSPQALVNLYNDARGHNQPLPGKVRGMVYLPGNGPKTIAALRWFFGNATHVWLRNTEYTQASKRSPAWPFNQHYTIHRINLVQDEAIITTEREKAP